MFHLFRVGSCSMRFPCLLYCFFSTHLMSLFFSRNRDLLPSPKQAGLLSDYRVRHNEVDNLLTVELHDHRDMLLNPTST